jgi:hypothetical protein
MISQERIFQKVVSGKTLIGSSPFGSFLPKRYLNTDIIKAFLPIPRGYPK